jgi:hypothetical protein
LGKSIAEKRSGARKESDSAKIYFHAWRKVGMESAGRSRKRASPPFLKKLQLYFSNKDREGLFLYLYYYIKPIILKPIINKPIFSLCFYIYTPYIFLKFI